MLHDQLNTLSEIHLRLQRVGMLLKISNEKYDREIMRHLYDNQTALTELLTGAILDATDVDQSRSEERGHPMQRESGDVAERAPAALIGTHSHEGEAS